MRESLIKGQQQRSVQAKLDSLFKPALLRSKTSTNSESSIDEQIYALCFILVFK